MGRLIAAAIAGLLLLGLIVYGPSMCSRIVGNQIDSRQPRWNQLSDYATRLSVWQADQHSVPLVTHFPPPSSTTPGSVFLEEHGFLQGNTRFLLYIPGEPNDVVAERNRVLPKQIQTQPAFGTIIQAALDHAGTTTPENSPSAMVIEVIEQGGGVHGWFWSDSVTGERLYYVTHN